MVQLEKAIMERLGAAADDTSTDLELASLLLGGVHSRTAGGEVYPFGTLTLVRMDEDHTFTRAWRWRFRYGFSVTDESESVDAASAALQRVYELLQDSGAFLTLEDFTVGFIRRAGRTQITPQQAGTTYNRITDEWKIEVYPND
jgi:hypothetical protein